MELSPDIMDVAKLIITAIHSGNKLLIFGNGGSAADAQHMAAEFVGSFERERKAIAAIALTTDTSILTSITNDYGADIVFARQIEALGKKGDIAIAFTTSGKSPNVIIGLERAKELGLSTVVLTGHINLRNELVDLTDHSIFVSSENTARIQEAHGLIIHILCSLVEDSLINWTERFLR